MSDSWISSALFKPLPVAREVSRDPLPESARSYARDRVTLGWEERLKARGRRLSDGGLEFGTALPRGSVLRAGDWLILDDLAAAVEVVECNEPVFVVEPESGSDWARYGYAIGNSHQPVMILESAIVCPDVPGMQQVLEYHGIPFQRASMPFTPASLGADPYSPNHQHSPSVR